MKVISNRERKGKRVRYIQFYTKNALRRKGINIYMTDLIEIKKKGITR